MTAYTAAQSRRRMVARVELAGSALCFGLMAILARKLTMPGMGFTAGHLAVLRFVVGALVSLAAFGLIPGLYRPSNYRLLVTRGVSGGAVVVLYFYALARIPAGEAGILYNMFPVIATVCVTVAVRVPVEVWVAVCVLVTVLVCVAVTVCVLVTVLVCVAVAVTVCVRVPVAVWVAVCVRVCVPVTVAVAVWVMVAVT